MFFITITFMKILKIIIFEDCILNNSIYTNNKQQIAK